MVRNSYEEGNDSYVSIGCHSFHAFGIRSHRNLEADKVFRRLVRRKRYIIFVFCYSKYDID